MGKYSRNSLLLGAVLLAVACSGGSYDGGGGGGAAATVKTFYEHLDSGRYDQAVALYDATTKEQLLPDEGAMEGFRQWAEMETHDGTLSKVDVVDQTEAEGSVTIEFQLSFDDGQTATRSVTLIEVDGAWRMGVIG